MERLEAKIRDYLVSHIHFISEDFKLIEKEYFLKNSQGTRGFIDILAEDSLQNFVVIEIKRSNQTAKQALHEVFKYAGLLKQNLRAKESEIRICIISTEWDELLIPFSEAYRTSTYFIEGYKITLDPDGIPCNKQIIQPIDKPLERKISYTQMTYLFNNEDSLNQAIEVVLQEVRRVGLIDFVLLKLTCKSGNKNVIYPHAIHLSFQRYSPVILRTIVIEHLQALKELQDVWDDLEPEHLTGYMEQIILSNINTDFCNTLEASSPEILSSVLECQKWEVSKVIRSGFFLDDPRLQNDDFLISQIKGFKGEGSTRYFNHSPSKLKSRIKEIRENSLAYLWNGEGADNTWFKHVDFAFNTLIQQDLEYDLKINIYNPKVGILSTLHYMLNCERFGGSHPSEFLPSYILQANFKHNENLDSIIYLGRLKWIDKSLKIDSLVEEAFNSDPWTYFLMSQLNADPVLDLKLMELLGFTYSTDVLFLSGEELKDIRSLEFEDGALSLAKLGETSYIEDFLESQFEFLAALNALYKQFVFIS